MEKTFYSGEEAAKLCGVHRVTISRWIKSGLIKAEKVGRTLVIPLAELAKCRKEIPEDKNSEIESAVKRVVKEYGETLDLLAKE